MLLMPTTLACCCHARADARLPPLPRARLPACLPACLPADAKVVQFYTKLRQRQLQALGLDPAQFKTIY